MRYVGTAPIKRLRPVELFLGVNRGQQQGTEPGGEPDRGSRTRHVGELATTLSARQRRTIATPRSIAANAASNTAGPPPYGSAISVSYTHLTLPTSELV